MADGFPAEWAFLMLGWSGKRSEGLRKNIQPCNLTLKVSKRVCVSRTLVVIRYREIVGKVNWSVHV